MTSNQLTTERILLIDNLVHKMSLQGSSTPSPLAQMDAAHFAAMRSRSGQISEQELRAIIYDRLFPVMPPPPHAA